MKRIIEMMNGTSSKLTAGALAGAVTGILVWVAGLLGLVIPPEVAVYISVLIGGIVGWLVPETATVDTDDSVVKSVISSDPSDVAELDTLDAD